MRRKKEVTIKYKPIKLLSDRYDIQALTVFVQNNLNLVYETIINMIFEAVQLNINEIDVFEFQDPKDILIFKKVEWKGFLERALPYFLKDEKYEVCAKITETQKLLSPIKRKRGRPKIKK